MYDLSFLLCYSRIYIDIKFFSVNIIVHCLCTGQLKMSTGVILEKRLIEEERRSNKKIKKGATLQKEDEEEKEDGDHCNKDDDDDYHSEDGNNDDNDDVENNDNYHAEDDNNDNDDERSWSDLLPEIVFSIVKKISFLDRRNAKLALPGWGSTINTAPCWPVLFAKDVPPLEMRILDPIEKK